MGPLFILNGVLLALIALLLCFVRRYAKSRRRQNVILIVAAFATVACHYSSLLYHWLKNGSAMPFLVDNPNLILPIYPCNVVMWSAVIYALLKNKDSRFGRFLGDYLFWFGIVSTLVGLFANVDFFNNPTLADYDVTKGIVAHATLLFNVLLIPLFGYTKIDVKRNMKHIAVSIVEMLVIGLYCNLVFLVLVSAEKAYSVNSMFLIHSPFEGVGFLTYPIISLGALVIYFGLFLLLDAIAHKKGERFFDRRRG